MLHGLERKTAALHLSRHSSGIAAALQAASKEDMSPYEKGLWQLWLSMTGDAGKSGDVSEDVFFNFIAAQVQACRSARSYARRQAGSRRAFTRKSDDEIDYKDIDDLNFNFQSKGFGATAEAGGFLGGTEAFLAGKKISDMNGYHNSIRDYANLLFAAINDGRGGMCWNEFKNYMLSNYVYIEKGPERWSKPSI